MAAQFPEARLPHRKGTLKPTELWQCPDLRSIQPRVLRKSDAHNAAKWPALGNHVV